MRQTRYRFIMLILAITFLLGQYFCYDNPSVIEKQMEETLGIDNEQWSMFFTVYSLPNILLPLTGGIFVDKMGIRAGIILYSVQVTFG